MVKKEQDQRTRFFEVRAHRVRSTGDHPMEHDYGSAGPILGYLALAVALAVMLAA
jgi:hypothetical protein